MIVLGLYKFYTVGRNGSVLCHKIAGDRYEDAKEKFDNQWKEHQRIVTVVNADDYIHSVHNIVHDSFGDYEVNLPSYLYSCLTFKNNAYLECEDLTSDEARKLMKLYKYSDLACITDKCGMNNARKIIDLTDWLLFCTYEYCKMISKGIVNAQDVTKYDAYCSDITDPYFMIDNSAIFALVKLMGIYRIDFQKNCKTFMGFKTRLENNKVIRDLIVSTRSD